MTNTNAPTLPDLYLFLMECLSVDYLSSQLYPLR